MNLQERFEKETGLPAKFKMQRYGGDRNGPEVWNDVYIEWLEEKIEELEYELKEATNE